MRNIKKTNSERRELTQGNLLKVAREMFSKYGFSDTNTPGLVKAAGVTRGALYHHFSDKKEIFRAVVESEASMVANEILRATDKCKTPKEVIQVGVKTYLSAMKVPGRTRLFLTEGPVVLGVRAIREIDMTTSAQILRQELLKIAGGGWTAPEVEALADMLASTCERAAMADSPDQEVYAAVLDKLISGAIERLSQPR